MELSTSFIFLSNRSNNNQEEPKSLLLEPFNNQTLNTFTNGLDLNKKETTTTSSSSVHSSQLENDVTTKLSSKRSTPSDRKLKKEHAEKKRRLKEKEEIELEVDAEIERFERERASVEKERASAEKERFQLEAIAKIERLEKEVEFLKERLSKEETTATTTVLTTVLTTDVIKKEPCMKFACRTKGIECNFGSRCWYYHDDKLIPCLTYFNTMKNNGEISRYCRYGNDCKYNHDANWYFIVEQHYNYFINSVNLLSPPPPPALNYQPPNQYKYDKTNVKSKIKGGKKSSKLCLFYKFGNCQNGDKCQFKHSFLKIKKDLGF